MCFAVSVLRCLLFFWIFCVVAECGDKEKRDVHRIVIKEGRPISHHKHHHHHHHHDHHKPKHHHNSHEEEHFRKNHSNRLKRRNKPPKKITTTTEPQEDYTPQENKVSQFFTDEWTPILGKNNQILQNPQKYDFKNSRNNIFSRRQTTPKPKFLHEIVDITTEYPGKRPKPFFERNKTKFLTSNSESSEESSFFDDPKIETTTRKKKKFRKPSTPGYEVYEDVKEDVKMPHPSSFRLNPIFDNNSKFTPFSEEDRDFFGEATNIHNNHTAVRNFGKKTKSKRTRGGIKRN